MLTHETDRGNLLAALRLFHRGEATDVAAAILHHLVNTGGAVRIVGRFAASKYGADLVAALHAELDLWPVEYYSKQLRRAVELIARRAEGGAS